MPNHAFLIFWGFEPPKLCCMCVVGAVPCGYPNFVMVVVRVRLPGTVKALKLNAPLLGNGRCHGNYFHVNWSEA